MRLWQACFFTCYQAPVSYAGVQCQARSLLYDQGEHAIAGNGATGALQRFFPSLKYSGYSVAARRAQLRALQCLEAWVAPHAKRLFGRNASKWSLQAAEHTPCEFYKWRLGAIFFAKVFGVTLSRACSRGWRQAPPPPQAEVIACIVIKGIFVVRIILYNNILLLYIIYTYYV